MICANLDEGGSSFAPYASHLIKNNRAINDFKLPNAEGVGAAQAAHAAQRQLGDINLKA